MCGQHVTPSNTYTSIDVDSRQSIHDDWVANALGCNALEVLDSRPSFRNISEIHFLESMQTQVQKNLKWST